MLNCLWRPEQIAACEYEIYLSHFARISCSSHTYCHCFAAHKNRWWRKAAALRPGWTIHYCFVSTPNTGRVRSSVPTALLAVYWAGCVYYAFSPTFYSTWLLENATVWVCLAPVIVLYCKGFVLRDISYFIIFVAAIMQTVGGHYGFAHVPIGDVLSEYLGLQRNCFDRIGHYVCGLLAFPVFNAFFLKLHAPKWLLCTISIMGMMGVAASYEIFEWFVVTYVDNMTAEEYIGWQGDPWDAQADMLMCLLGGLTTIPFACAYFGGKSGRELD